MSSRWLIRTQKILSNSRRADSEHSDDSSQSLTFEQLAQLLADGAIEELDLVKPDEGMDWQPVETVIGLCRAADKLRNAQRQNSEFHGDDTNHDATLGTVADSASGPIRYSVSKPVSWVRVLLLSASFGVAAWACWSFWNESRRFPRPAHLTNSLQPWILPGIGAVSGLEAMMLAMDAIAIFVFLFWWFRTKCKMH